MKDPCVLCTITLIFGLLASLQGVSTNEAVQKCDNLSCPKGFTCCDNECCPERKAWHPEKEPLMYLFIILLFMVVLWCICGTVECLYSNCKIEQHDGRTGDHQNTPEPPSIAPLESIWVTSMDPPPPYSQVVLNPTPSDPPPPYSPRPEGPAGQMRGDAYDTL